MKTSRIARLLNDLAGYWTEPVLEILTTAGNVQTSVQREIEIWRTLNAALQSEIREQRVLGASPCLSTVKEQVFARAIAEVAQKHNLRDERFLQSTLDRRSSAAEHRVFQELVREPTTRSPFSSARQTDFAPRFQMSAVAG